MPRDIASLRQASVTTPVLYAPGTLTTAFSFIVILGFLLGLRVLARKRKA